MLGCEEGPTDPSTHFTARVSGVVVDAVTGQPIGGAEVTKLRVDMDCEVDQDGAIHCENDTRLYTDHTDIRGRYSLRYPDSGTCRRCQYHESGQCTSTQLLVNHLDYESYSFEAEILCQSDEQTLPDIELVPLGG